MVRAIGAVVLGLLVPGMALAENSDGNWLYRYCSSPTGDISYAQQVALCVGFVQGVAETLVATKQLGQSTAPVPCYGEGSVTAGQLKDVVTKYLAGHPEVRHYDAASLVMRALVEAFPCKR
jgi:hypothetical protein